MDIIDKANELGKMLRDNSKVKRYKEAEVNYLNDKSIQKEYEEYKNLFSSYLQSKDSSLEDVIDSKYNNLLKSKVFTEYLESKKEFEGLMSTVNELVNYYVEYDSKGKGCSGCSKKGAGCSGCSK